MNSRSLFFTAVLIATAPFLDAQDQAPTSTPASEIQTVPAPALPGTQPALDSAPEEPQAPAAAWFLDYQAARNKAIAENKHLLLLFTGSDWIPLCRIFDRDVLNQPDFIDAVSDEFVLVRFDFPKERKLSPSLAAQNQLFMRAYRVSAFPTVFLTDPDGRPYGLNGYQAVTPADYGKVISAMRQMGTLRDQFFAKADETEGFAKAEMLVKGVPNLPGNLSARYYREQLEAIIKNDVLDQSGKVEKCRRLLADVDYADAMQKMERAIEWSKMLTLTDAYIHENNLQGPERQQALFNKINVFQKQGNVAEVVRTLLEIASIDENSAQGQKAQGALDRLRAQKLEEGLSPR